MSIISFINLKGGVGKSTTAVAFAEFLAGHHHRRVLLIDLDPQTNATVALIGDQQWLTLNKAGKTLHRLFLTPFATTPQPFALDDLLVCPASSVIDCANRVTLLPSSTNLIGQESVVEAIAAVTHYELEPHSVLRAAFQEEATLLSRFDDIIIDCPPSLNIITLNGLSLSDAYLIPVMPEQISLYGVPQIVRNVQRLTQRFGRPIPALGILFNRVDNRLNLHKQQMRVVSQRVQIERQAGNMGYPTPFTNFVYERTLTTSAMQPGFDPQTLHDKYADGNRDYSSWDMWIKTTTEYLERCSLLTTSLAS